MEDLGLAKTELQSLWAERGIVATDLAVDRGGTIVRRQEEAAAVTWSAVVDQLPPARLEGGPPLVSLGELLGRGGMGEVRTGRQPSLDRDVAVKVSRAFAPRWALEILGTTGALALVMLGRTWRGDARTPNG